MKLGEKKVFEACTVGRAKLINVVPLSQHKRSKMPGELLVCLSSVEPPESAVAMQKPN